MRQVSFESSDLAHVQVPPQIEAYWLDKSLIFFA